MKFYTFVFLCLSLRKDSMVTSSFSNSILGSPLIDCQARRIDLTVNTKEPFKGKLYIKGNAHRKECVTDYSQSPPDNLTELRSVIDYNICNTERIRSLSPVGVTYANTIIIQFHQTFITKGDKSFHIRCFYAESEKTVKSDFEVSMIPTGAIFRDMELPSCGYTVRGQTHNGPLIRSAKVGDQVFHRWECHGNNDFYGMAVHSCFVENTDGRQSQIIDSFGYDNHREMSINDVTNQQGCSTDSYLLPDLVYSNDLSLAYSETQVFKYPDYSYIHFRCQIRICTKMDGSCKGITPPNCEKKRRARSLGSYSDTLSPNDASLDVVTRDILVLEETDGLNSSLLGSSRSPSSRFSSSPSGKFSTRTQSADLTVHRSQWQLCVNRTILISLLMGFVLFFFASLSFVVYVMVHQHNVEHTKNFSSVSLS